MFIDEPDHITSVPFISRIGGLKSRSVLSENNDRTVLAIPYQADSLGHKHRPADAIMSFWNEYDTKGD
jgi:hypothetical protein